MLIKQLQLKINVPLPINCINELIDVKRCFFFPVLCHWRLFIICLINNEGTKMKCVCCFACIKLSIILHTYIYFYSTENKFK